MAIWNLRRVRLNLILIAFLWCCLLDVRQHKLNVDEKRIANFCLLNAIKQKIY